MRINGTYADVTGQCVADIGAGAAWMLGCTFENSDGGDGYGVYSGLPEMWLDTCVSVDNAVDLRSELEATIFYIHDFTGGGTNDIAGTLTEY